MPVTRYSLGATVRLYVDITGVTGQSPVVGVQRTADGRWFQASDNTWQLTLVENPAVPLDAVKLPGRYYFDFDQSLDDLEGSRAYIVKKWNYSGTLFSEFEDIVFGPLAGTTEPELCSVQGTIYDAQGKPVQNHIVRAILVPIYKDALGRTVESDRVVATYTNELGDFDLPLVRGGTFKLEIPGVGYARKVIIPDQSSVLFTDL
jgi:hypothetical protein